MKNNLFIIYILSIFIIFSFGCNANSVEDDDYANYSQDIEDTSINEINKTDNDSTTIITSQSNETTSQTTNTDNNSNDTSNVTTITSDTTTEKSTTIVTTVTNTKSTSIATTVTTIESTTVKIEYQEEQDSQIMEQLMDNQEEQNNQATEQPMDNQEEQDNQNSYLQSVDTNISTENIAYFDINDMYFYTNDGYSFTVDMNIDEVITNLGDNYILESAPSCYYDYDDKVYIYDDFAIYTYTLDGYNYYIQEIELLNDTVSTDKDIKIGSSLTDIEDTYGANYQIFENEYRFYVNDNTYLYFFIFDGIVDSLGYRIEIEL